MIMIKSVENFPLRHKHTYAFKKLFVRGDIGGSEQGVVNEEENTPLTSRMVDTIATLLSYTTDLEDEC